jgi:predicted glycogen debranching enzyme
MARVLPPTLDDEWLETDGLGGFASGTTSGIRTRRYHALLLAATTPPTGRVVLVNGWEAWIETPNGAYPLSTHHYAPDVLHPDGRTRIAWFAAEPWPRWHFRLEDGTEIEQELFVRHGAPVAALSWRLRGRRRGVTLWMRPLLSGRDYHALHHENPAFRFEADQRDGRIVWRPYPGLPGIAAVTNGSYIHQPNWYRRFLYREERARGLDCVEDLASPGVFRWDLSHEPAVWMAGTDEREHDAFPVEESPLQTWKALRAAEHRRRASFPSRLHRAADAYLVRRGKGHTIVAGYPWFTDWGRDTFIALRGLCLATGRLEEAREVLIEWAGAMSEGMLPNRFPDWGEAPEFNSVDASLWYIIAIDEYWRTMRALGRRGAPRDRAILKEAIEQILCGYAEGTRYGIHLDEDGLLAAGVPRVALTWMDAMVDGRPVTPRVGKPVEVNALWLNALHIGGRFSTRWRRTLARGIECFRARFWNSTEGYLYDVVDPDHRCGTVDPAFRPNQIFAAGGLPLVLLDPDRARQVVHAVEERLWTSMGLRSLAQGEPGYAPRMEGGAAERDAAYHQGTVWPWLIGPFVEAWVRVRGNTARARRDARARFLAPLLRHLDEGGLGHIAEAADGDPPHTPRGCPFQAWSLGEVLRLTLVVLAHPAGRRTQER